MLDYKINKERVILANPESFQRLTKLRDLNLIDPRLITLITNNESSGGSERSIQEMVNLAKRGHDIVEREKTKMVRNETPRNEELLVLYEMALSDLRDVASIVFRAKK